jgi:hypothetical protein
MYLQKPTEGMITHPAVELVRAEHLLLDSRLSLRAIPKTIAGQPARKRTVQSAEEELCRR